MWAPSPLLAVHLADGVITFPWVLGGFAAAGLLIQVALLLDWFRQRQTGEGLSEAEIVHLGLFTAAFYVASLIHVRIGPTSVHLLLNGLLGVVLGWRAALAIPVGLLLQAALFGHGGFTTLGVNSCVLVLPALAARGLFVGLDSSPWLHLRWFRGLLVTLAGAVWCLGVVLSISLLLAPLGMSLEERWWTRAEPLAESLFTYLGCLVFGGLLAWQEPKLEPAPYYAVGLVVGTLSVLFTMVLVCGVLWLGGAENWSVLVVATFVAHLPIAALEGLILGFTLSFLEQVKPELLGVKKRQWRSNCVPQGKAHTATTAPNGEQPTPETPSAPFPQRG